MTDFFERECVKRIQTGSKSFAFAGRFLEPQVRLGAFALYSWCRHVDDAIDLAGGDSALVSSRLREIRDGIDFAYEGKTSEVFAFEALRWVVAKWNIPKEYPVALWEGLRMDATVFADGEWGIRTEEDLRLYCYRVAGVVGVMMAYVMGARDPGAVRHAAALGEAMQMTNIARDVKEDFQLGRCYLPREWETAETSQVRAGFDSERMYPLVVRLLGEAELSYDLGLQGISYLSKRSRRAIAVAAKVYREIGRRILSKGMGALEHRQVVPLWRKVTLLGGRI